VDWAEIDTVAKELILMKRAGVKIHSTEKFLEKLVVHGPGLDWKCPKPVNAVIDADLSMRACLHLPGQRVRRWDAFTLIGEETWKSFLEDWSADQQDLCPCCYWDCQYEVAEGDQDEVDAWFSHKR